MSVDLTINRSGRSTRGYVQVWILVSLTGLLVATSLGLMLTMGHSDASSERRADAADEAEARAPREYVRYHAQHSIARAEGTPWTAQELVARHQQLINYIHQPQQPKAEEEPEGPPIEVKVTGAAHRKIAPEMAQRLESISPEVSKCYRRRLRAKPSLRGKVFFSFTLVNDGDHGRVDKAHIAASKVKDVRLESCILKALSDASFPLAFADDVWASKERWYHYNFNLQRNDGDLRAGVARKRKNP